MIGGLDRRMHLKPRLFDVLCVGLGISIGRYLSFSHVVGPSMLPALQDGDLLLTAHPSLFTLVPGDAADCLVGRIVTFKMGASMASADDTSDDNDGRMFCKRVCSLCSVWRDEEVDRECIEEPSMDITTRVWEQEFKRRAFVPGNTHLWLAGDNAENSSDSRSFGPVHPSRVKGVAIAILWPPSRVAVI